MLLIRRCLKDLNCKQRVPFLALRKRLERALDRIARPLAEGGSLVWQPGSLTPQGYLELVNRDNLGQFAGTEEGEEPRGLQVVVVEQGRLEDMEFKMFQIWMATTLSLQLSAVVELLHEPPDAADPVASVRACWCSTCKPHGSSPSSVPANCPRLLRLTVGSVENSLPRPSRCADSLCADFASPLVLITHRFPGLCHKLAYVTASWFWHADAKATRRSQWLHFCTVRCCIACEVGQ